MSTKVRKCEGTIVTMIVLITGHQGFIGQHLLKQCMKNEDVTEVYTWSRSTAMDITVEKHVMGGLLHVKPDVIFHLAGNPLNKLDEANQSQIIIDNVIGTQNLLHFAPKGCRFVFASSIVVYGDSKGICSEQTIPNPTSVYGMTKISAEHLVNIYTSMGRVDGINARMCAQVGLGATHGVVKDFIRKLKSDSEYLEILGDSPGSSKPYMNVENTAEILYNMGMKRELFPNRVYNVCPNDNLSVEDLAKCVMASTGIHKPIKWLGEGANWVGDNRLLNVSSQFRNMESSKEAVLSGVSAIVGEE